MSFLVYVTKIVFLFFDVVYCKLAFVTFQMQVKSMHIMLYQHSIILCHIYHILCHIYHILYHIINDSAFVFQ